MRNKYLDNLQRKISNLNEHWVYDRNQPDTPLVTGGIGSDMPRHPTPAGPDEVVGQEINKNPDGSSTVTIKYGNGRTETKRAKNQQELKALLGL